MDPHDDGAVTTEDGRTDATDLVAGADEHKSLARTRSSRETEPQDTGFALWRGIVAEDRLPHTGR